MITIIAKSAKEAKQISGCDHVARVDNGGAKGKRWACFASAAELKMWKSQK